MPTPKDGTITVSWFKFILVLVVLVAGTVAGYYKNTIAVDKQISKVERKVDSLNSEKRFDDYKNEVWQEGVTGHLAKIDTTLISMNRMNHKFDSTQKTNARKLDAIIRKLDGDTGS